MNPDKLMQYAIEAARSGIDRGQSPFGCAIAKDGELLVAAHNVVWMTTDITAHAEVTAIRMACKETHQIHLAGCEVATTCEPCPMCTAALHWARVETVYYGATIADAADAGFNELKMDAAQLLGEGGSQVKLKPEVLRDECRGLFQTWKETHGNAY